MADHQTFSLLLPPGYLVPATRRVHRLKLRHRNYPTPLVSNDASESETTDYRNAGVDNAGVKVALSMLKFYKREISPILPKSDRYVPTCSEYSMGAYKSTASLKVGQDSIRLVGLMRMSSSIDENLLLWTKRPWCYKAARSLAAVGKVAAAELVFNLWFR